MADQDSGYCSNCAALEAQVAQLQAQVAHLQRENGELRQRLAMLLQQINIARAMCLHVIAESGKVLSQKSGVQRAVWAFNRGAHAVASKLLEVLQG